MSCKQLNRILAATIAAWTSLMLVGCGGGEKIPKWNPQKDRAAMTGADAADRVILQSGDPIVVTFNDVPPPGIQEWKGRIGEDGNIILHLNVSIKAAGKTPNQVGQEIRDSYVPKYYKYLTVTVKPEERFYFVGGEVRMGDKKIYLMPMTVTRAIDTAGGFSDYAKKSEIILTRANGDKFTVDYNKAIKDPAHDPPVFPNDRVEVKRRVW